MSKIAKKISKMDKAAKRSSKSSNAMHKIHKKAVKSRALRKFQKTRPKKYMNAFLCFLQEERKHAKQGHLVAEWRAVHKGLGSKWRALGAGKAAFSKQAKVPPFAAFIMHSEKRKAILPEWRKAHKGLGAK